MMPAILSEHRGVGDVDRPVCCVERDHRDHRVLDRVNHRAARVVHNLVPPIPRSQPVSDFSFCPCSSRSRLPRVEARGHLQRRRRFRHHRRMPWWSRCVIFDGDGDGVNKEVATGREARRGVTLIVVPVPDVQIRRPTTAVTAAATGFAGHGHRTTARRLRHNRELAVGLSKPAIPLARHGCRQWP